MADTLTVGRIGWWRFQNGDLSDQSGNGRDLVVTGTQVNATDKDGIANNAVNLYNSSYYKTNDVSNPLKNLSSWSMAIWINFKNYLGYEGYLSFKSGGFGVSAYQFRADGSTTLNIHSATPIARPVNGWHLFIFEFNGTEFKTYIDDVLIQTTSATIITEDANNLIIGKRIDNPERYPNADFDEISMYSRILTTDERAELLARGVNYNPDTTPPSFNSVNIDTITYNSSDLNVNLNEDGKVYYQLLVRDATTPTSAEVKANPDGQVNVTASTTSIIPLIGLTANTQYDCYVVAEDSIPNLQLEPTKIQFTTLPLGTVATPTTNLPSGAYYTDGDNPLHVVLSCETVGATIRYSFYSDEVTEDSPVIADGETLVIWTDVGEVVKLRTKAFKDGYTESDLVTFEYTTIEETEEEEDMKEIMIGLIFLKLRVAGTTEWTEIGDSKTEAKFKFEEKFADVKTVESGNVDKVLESTTASLEVGISQLSKALIDKLSASINSVTEGVTPNEVTYLEGGAGIGSVATKYEVIAHPIEEGTGTEYDIYLPKATIETSIDKTGKAGDQLVFNLKIEGLYDRTEKCKFRIGKNPA